MEWINYHHLLYFWRVAREGGLARASAGLGLAQSTVSKQIHQLEAALGHPLFARKGRRLVLTESGRVVYRYAEEIFSLGRELVDTLGDRPVGQPLRVTVGVADVVPKLVAERVLLPAFASGPVRLVCREGRSDRLLAELALYELDLVLTDAPAAPTAKVRAYSRLLGGSEVAFFARPPLASRLRRGFPRSLDGAPLLLPTADTMMRRSLERWFADRGLRPALLGEFEDSALLGAFGQQGIGAFPAPTVIRREIEGQLGVRWVGDASGVRESLYALTAERRIQNPAVAGICDAAEAWLGTSAAKDR